MKGKVITMHAVKAYMGLEVWLHSFLTSALDGDRQRHAPAVLLARRDPGTRCEVG